MEAAPIPLFARRTILAAALAAPVAAQSPGISARTSLASAAMQADLTILHDAYLALHPGLDRYLGRARWTALTARATRWAAQPRSAGDFYLQLARLTAAVKCGHSYPNPNNFGRTVREGLLSGRNRVPFTFRWLDGQMVVTGSLGERETIPAGSIVTQLDGMAPPALMRAMLPLARADGSNDAKRVAQLQVNGQERYAAFDVLRPLLDSAAGEIVRIAYSAPNGRRNSTSLPAMTEAEREVQRGGHDAFAGWRFALEDGIGRLTMPSWATYDSKADWRTFLNEAVDRLIAIQARGLIVDIRSNEGGEDCGDVLLSRLIDTPLQPAREARRTRYRATPAVLRPVLDTWDAQFQDWGEQATGPDSAGFYELQRPSDDRNGTIMPSAPRFARPVVVLVDAECSSATFQFAQLVQHSGRARIVGSPTGGNKRGINGGAFFFVSLPGTQMEVDLPIMGFFPLTPQPDAGLIPDVPVRLTAPDLAAGRDPALAAARQLLG